MTFWIFHSFVYIINDISIKNFWDRIMKKVNLWKGLHRYLIMSFNSTSIRYQWFTQIKLTATGTIASNWCLKNLAGAFNCRLEPGNQIKVTWQIWQGLPNNVKGYFVQVFCTSLNSNTFVDMGGVGFGSRLQCWFLVKESPFLLAQAWLTLLLSLR